MGNNTLSSLSSPFAQAMSRAAGVKHAVLPQEAGGTSGQDDAFENGLGLLQSFGNQDESAFGEEGLPTRQQDQQENISRHREAFAPALNPTPQEVFNQSKVDAEKANIAELNALRKEIQQQARPKIGNANVDLIHDQTLVEVKTSGQGTKSYFDNLARSLKLVVAQINSADAWAREAAAKKASQTGDAVMDAHMAGNTAFSQSADRTANSGQ